MPGRWKPTLREPRNGVFSALPKVGFEPIADNGFGPTNRSSGLTFPCLDLLRLIEPLHGKSAMNQRAINRRQILVGATTLVALPSTLLAQSGPVIHVLKDPNCGCCSAWIRILQTAGFRVTSEASFGTALVREKIARGIPQDMISCHTAEVGGYAIEGHVPPVDILRLLTESPDAVGLAVPDMPYGSPGMGPETEREAYDVYLIHRDGTSEVFTRYDAA